MSTVWIFNQYSTTPRTGFAGRSHYFAKELAKRGHTVRLHAARFHHLIFDLEANDAAPDVEEIEGYEFQRIPVPRYSRAHDKKRILNWVIFSHRIAKLHNRTSDRPDVILYSSPSLLGILGAHKLAKRVGARLVWDVRDIWPLTLMEVGDYSPKHPFIRYLQRVEDRAYQLADRVICNQPYSYEHMVAHGMPREKFAWISNGFSLEETENADPLDPALAEALPKDGFVIGYAGTMGHANALDNLIEATALVGDRAKLSVVLVGKGQEREGLEALAKAKGLTNVQFFDAIPKRQVPSLLPRFDALFIGMTRSNLFRYGVSPNKLYDYMIAARPIINAIDSGRYKPVEECDAGVHVPPEDPAALAEAMIEMSQTSEEERRRMGENGRKAALEQYEFGQLTEKLEDVLGIAGGK